MKKTARILPILLALVFALSLLPASAFAANGTGTILNATWVYASPSSSSATVCVAQRGATVEIVSVSGTWYQIIFNGATGYVRASDITMDSAPSADPAPVVDSSTPATDSTAATGSTATGSTGSASTATGSTKGIGTGVLTGNCNFRTGPSVKNEKVSGCNKVKKGTSVTILNVSTDGKWYNIVYGNYTGWVSKDYCRVTSGTNSSGQAVSAKNYASFSGKLGSESDRWGSMTIAGTNIAKNIYSNAVNAKGVFYYNSYSSSYNYVYALSYISDPVAVIYGHNMRGTAKKGGKEQGLHQLHHIQNAWLGVSKCEYCGADCSASKTSTFDINYNGHSQWKLVAFYEVNKSNVSGSSTRKNIEIYNSFNSTLTGSALESWIATQLQYAKTSGMKGAVIDTVTSSDKVMMLVTCADSSGNGNQRLYMLLKAAN